MCICNEQIKETEHSSLKNSQGIWESHEKVVRHVSSETAWALKDGRSPPVRVLGGASADELPMTIVGLASALLHTFRHACLHIVSNIVIAYLVQPQHDASLVQCLNTLQGSCSPVIKVFNRHSSSRGSHM